MSEEEKSPWISQELAEEATEHLKNAPPGKIFSIASSKPSDEDIARDLKYRVQQAMIPVLDIMDEALKHRMHVQWDGLGPISDGFTVRNGITNLKIIRIL